MGKNVVILGAQWGDEGKGKIVDWLYCRYLENKVDDKPVFNAEIQDIMRGGLRVLLQENGASIFIPASTIHDNKEDVEMNNEELAFYIKGERKYKIGDIIKVQLTEVKEETRSLIGNIIE